MIGPKGDNLSESIFKTVSQQTFTNTNEGNSYFTLNNYKNFSTSDLRIPRKSFLQICKDPGIRPFCDKTASFEQNYPHLPENRFKLVVSDIVIRNDQAAIKRITQKLENEANMEIQKQQMLHKFRLDNLSNYAKRKTKTEDLQKKTGLTKYKTMNMLPINKVNNRIQSLSVPRAGKKRYIDDYIETYGLLGAERVKGSRSVLPGSSRITENKTLSPDNKQESFKRSLGKTSYNKEDKNIEIFSDKEIADCMKEINEFHKRFGELKGRVGFPQIYLEKYKN
ncbi:hypothetical protein SteCoe_27600 [Stentor coeruleus]|uniref:Uncharacterized protein n=1 Tax=Stentor coeruleus TaxID=5963 RepID=A0A1R2BAF4_9CILI|nr:hypothetical protein SteCoe_27600 [Stentor coeruleus]